MSPTENSSKESKGLLTTGATKVKKKRKSVSWKEDHQLKEIFYFELDEDERGRCFIPLGEFTIQVPSLMSLLDSNSWTVRL